MTMRPRRIFQGAPPRPGETADFSSQLGHHRFESVLMEGTCRRLDDAPWAWDPRRSRVRCDTRDEAREATAANEPDAGSDLTMRDAHLEAPRDGVREIGPPQERRDNVVDAPRERRHEPELEPEPERESEHQREQGVSMPPAHHEAPAAPNLRHAEAESRSLSTAATGSSTATRTGPSPRTPPTQEPARRASLATQATQRATRASAPRQATTRATQATGNPDRPEHDDDVPQPWRLAGLSGPAPDGWSEQLAERVGELCRRADPAIQSWQVTVPLDPKVLPETQLHMALSPERLALRFQTQSTYSFGLVSNHEPHLVRLLRKALPFPRQVDVETT